MRTRVFLVFSVLMLTLTGSLAAKPALPELWGLGFGTTWSEAETQLTTQGKTPDVILDGPQLGREQADRIMMFKAKSVLGKGADTVQLIFTNNKLTKIRVFFKRGENSPGWFDTVYADLAWTIRGQYFPAQRTLPHLKLGAVWSWDTGQAIYLGFVTESDLVLIMEEKATDLNDEPGLFPRPSP